MFLYRNHVLTIDFVLQCTEPKLFHSKREDCDKLVKDCTLMDATGQMTVTLWDGAAAHADVALGDDAQFLDAKVSMSTMHKVKILNINFEDQAQVRHFIVNIFIHK